MLFLVKFQPLPVSLRKSFRDIDYAGTFLFIAGITSILIPITWAGVMYDWDSWRVLVPLILGLAGIAAFLCYERFLARNPPIPLSILTTRTAIVTYIGTAVHGFILWAGLYYLPLYFQAVKEYSPINSAIALFPVTFTVAPGAVITGLIITKTGRYRWTIWIGWAASTIGLGLCCLIKPATGKAEYVIFMLVSGFGLGVCFSSIVFAIQASVKPSEVSIAISMFSFFRTLGQTIGVAIGGTIFQNRMRVNLRSYPELSPYAIQYSKDAASLVEVIHTIQDGEAKTHLIHAYADSLRVLWGTCCGLAGLAGILSIRTQEFTLDRPLDTQQGLLTDSKQELNGAESSRGEP